MIPKVNHQGCYQLSVEQYNSVVVELVTVVCSKVNKDIERNSNFTWSTQKVTILRVEYGIDVKTDSGKNKISRSCGEKNELTSINKK